MVVGILNADGVGDGGALVIVAGGCSCWPLYGIPRNVELRGLALCVVVGELVLTVVVHVKGGCVHGGIDWSRLGALPFGVKVELSWTATACLIEVGMRVGVGMRMGVGMRFGVGMRVGVGSRVKL